MTPLDQFLKEVREKRESTGRCIWRFEKPQDGSVWEDGEYITFALTNQERFEKLVRVAVEALEFYATEADLQIENVYKTRQSDCTVKWKHIGHRARNALIQMNEIAGEK